MSDRPFMQLYTSDFLGDTQDLSAEYVGAYLLLLMTMWNAGGSLAFDEVKLARVARLTVEEWRLAWQDLGRFFDVVDARLTNNRVTSELAKFARKSAARQDAGRRGGQAKALKDKNTGLAIAKPNALASSRNQNKRGAQALLDPTEKTVDVSKHVEPEVFAECVRRTGPVKDFIEHKHFPSSLVAEVRAHFVKQESVH